MSSPTTENWREIHPKPCTKSIKPPMDSAMFRKYGHDLIDWAVNYKATLSKRNVTGSQKPGWLRNVVPKDPPQKGVSFDEIMNDLEEVVIKGNTHWMHRQFFAYFPNATTWPSLLGDILSNGTGAIGQSWRTCPVITEMETLVMDWYCKLLGLPRFFLSSYTEPESDGQGIIQTSASNAILYSMIWARQDAVKKLKKKYPNKPKAVLLNMMVAYCNHECHSSVEKAAMVGHIRLRKIIADPIGVVRKNALRLAIEEDVAKGLVPFYHCAIIGSTGITSHDDLMEVGPLCRKYDMWLHVDGAYGGSAFCTPEMKYMKQGMEFLWSININANKWLLTTYDATMHWVRYRSKAVDCMAGDGNLVRKYPNGVGPDLRHFGVDHSRRFKVVKMYFTVRNYGIDGLRRQVRSHCNLARLFEMYVRRDGRFEVCGGPFRFGLCAFRLKGYNLLTTRLLDALNASRKIHMVPSHFHDKVVIRFAVVNEHANEADVDRAWQTIDEYASVILKAHQKEHAGDPSMQNLYEQQREHDKMHELFPVAEEEAEEAEAANILSRLDLLTEEDAMINMAEMVDRDGSWGTAEEIPVVEHDRKLGASKELLKKSSHRYRRIQIEE